MGTTIAVQDDTHERLDALRSEGQSFDGVLTEILDHLDDELPEVPA